MRHNIYYFYCAFILLVGFDNVGCCHSRSMSVLWIAWFR